MKIEKRKVVNSSKLNNFTKSAIATALGIAASIGTTACDDSISATGNDKKTQEPKPTCGEVACGEQFSSSSYTDISSSGERLSSEAIEALSSAKQLSSSSMEPIQEAGVIPPYEDFPSSSSFEPPISSGAPLIFSPSSSESSSSSSVAPLSSSAKEPASSSSETMSSSSEAEDPLCDPSDPTTRCKVDLCKDPDGCLIFSMVTTFEQDDIQV